MKQRQEYYIGLDCGTSSVGWAVTDEKYDLLKTKRKVKKNDKTKSKQCTLWGVRLFDEAETAATRRIARSTRRRNARAKERLKLLRLLFRDEIAKVDPEFYNRLRESFYYEEDKNLVSKSKNTLFNDPDFTDKDYYNLYPTIWHLRQAIIKADDNVHFDIRLYFLAIQHILAHRGHFLLEGDMGKGQASFQPIFDVFYDACEDYYRLNDSAASSVERIIEDKSRSKIDKKKELKEILFIEDDGDEEALKGQTELAGLLIGSKVSLTKIFGIESDEDFKYSFAEGVFEDKIPDIEMAIGAENMDLIRAAKQVYDYAILHNLLNGREYISDAMVANYDQHKKDLSALKLAFKPLPESYNKLFKEKIYDASKTPNKDFPIYQAYIGKARSAKGKPALVGQDIFNAQLVNLMESRGITGELLDRAQKGELLPKQRGQAKGTIPQQLHHNELKIILNKLTQDYPSFGVENQSESEKYNTLAKKIASIHSFRIPYYCGPIAKRKYDEQGNLVPGGKSQFSWADEEITELVRPWNFDRLVNKDQRATNFIRRMTNECTYLLGEDVLPKSSLLYQKYMVLNELNNLRINGQRIDNDLKRIIFEQGCLTGELSGNITIRSLERWLKNGFIGVNDELSGTSEAKYLPKLQTYQDFRKILGEDFEKKYNNKQLERVIEAITILGDEKQMLTRRIRDELNCSEEVAKKLAKRSYKDWGKFSAKFLNGIAVNNQTILDWLWNDNKNLMELLGREVGFGKVVEEHNNLSGKKPKAGAKIHYSNIQDLYCSPAVKRSVWQTIKIVDELTKTQKHAPTKIFIEVTRDGDVKAKGKYTLARKKDLEAKLKSIKSEEAQEILNELSIREDRDLQSKKLFLYFSQMGKCAYSGEPINLDEINNSSLYDIDHIYPRSKTKDDSITRNLVLVKAELNREKTNVYPISVEIRNKMSRTWQLWYRSGLITKEKYERLTRASGLTPDELGGFIARQIIETSQTVKAIRSLLQSAYPDTKVISVKAGQVSDFRHLFANGIKFRNSNQYKIQPRPAFIKVRELNDFHHAKDAYLNIVVGNVMSSTFTDDPYSWIKEREGKEYSIRPELLFRASEEYQKSDGRTTRYPEVQNWDFANSINLVSSAMARNDILWTRMNYVESSEISDLQIVPHSDKTDGVLPIKRDSRLAQINKYGGYNSIKGAFFALIECNNKKNELERRIVSIPQIYKDKVDQFVKSKYQGGKVILTPIKYKSKLKINGVPLYITGKTGSRFSYQHGIQLILPSNHYKTLKTISRVLSKDKNLNGKYEIDLQKDGISDGEVVAFLDVILVKVKNYENIPSLETPMAKIQNCKVDFALLDLKKKCRAIQELLKIFSCNAERADLSSFIPKASQVGMITTGNNLDLLDSAFLINQSPAGLYEEQIDLKTIQPQNLKKKAD